MTFSFSLLFSSFLLSSQIGLRDFRHWIIKNPFSIPSPTQWFLSSQYPIFQNPSSNHSQMALISKLNILNSKMIEMSKSKPFSHSHPNCWVSYFTPGPHLARLSGHSTCLQSLKSLPIYFLVFCVSRFQAFPDRSAQSWLDIETKIVSSFALIFCRESWKEKESK
jgi:hypothetical protein